MNHLAMEQDPHLVFMNPQTENLQKLYQLVGELSSILNRNKIESNKLLQHIDTLANKLARDNGINNFQRDAHLVKNFLKQRGIESELNTGDDIRLETFKKQNQQLKRILDQKNKTNRETLKLLEYHEDSLGIVVKLLRNDVYKYHTQLIQKYKNIFNKCIGEVEDEEFKKYLENICDLQDLINISRVYQTLFRLEFDIK